MAAGLVTIGFKWLEHGEGLEVPRQQSSGAAGLDLRAAIEKDTQLIIEPGRRAIVPTGFSIALPLGFEAQIRPRSGLAAKYGVTTLNAPGTIDADYRGEVKVILINHGEDKFIVERGDRIAQMVVASICQVEFELKTELNETGRGTGGHGSTGKR